MMMPRFPGRRSKVQGRRPPSTFDTRRSTSPGFTLLELVVSSSVTVGILSAAYLCLQAGVASEKLVASRMDVAQNARVALALVTADLHAACKLTDEFEFVGMQRMMGDVEADNMDFATHNWRPRAPGEGDYCEVSYYVDRNPETGVLGLWRRRDPSPDDSPFDGGTKEEIAVGLAGLRFEYSDGFLWHDTWGKSMGSPSAETPRGRDDGSLGGLNTIGLPEAVRITLALRRPAPPPERNDREEKPDPPLVFQTVAYLNLADRSWSLSSGSTASYSSATSTPAAAPGGNGR